MKLEEVEKLTAGGSLVLSVGETDAKLKAMLSEALNDADARLAQKDDECAALRDSIDALRRDVKELQGQAVVITAERSAAEVTPAVVHQLSLSFCWRPHWCCYYCSMSQAKVSSLEEQKAEIERRLHEALSSDKESVSVAGDGAAPVAYGSR